MKNLHWLIAACIGIMFLGFLCGRDSKKCPQIQTGMVTVRDSIVIRDTILVQVPVEKIVVRIKKIPQYITIRDTTGVQVEQREENIACYSAAQLFEDSASVNMEICSRALPVNKPADLSWRVEYKPAPNTIRIETRMDTLSKPHPWKHFKLFGFGCGIGITAGAIGAILMGR